MLVGQQWRRLPWRWSSPSCPTAHLNCIWSWRHIWLVAGMAELTVWRLYTKIHLYVPANGLQGRALWDVTHATLVSQITYASPSWRGFIKAEETARLNSILSKARCFGYLPTDFQPLSLYDLQEQDASDESLFTSTQYHRRRKGSVVGGHHVCIELSINMQDTPTTDSRGVLESISYASARKTS